MAYLGSQLTSFDPTRTVAAPRDADRFSGNASTVTFTLSRFVQKAVDLEVYVENVRQEPLTAYDVNGTSLTFTGAPPSGTNNVYVVYRNFDSGAQSYVPDGSITYNKLANNIRIFTTDNLVPNGSTVAFTLSEPPADANTVMVTVDGIIQRAPVHYTTSGSTITFTSAPAAGSNVHVRHLGFRTSATVTQLAANSFISQPNINGGIFQQISQIDVGPLTQQTNSLLRVRRSGNSIEWGHANTQGYQATLGCELNTGSPFVAFFAEGGTNIDTYKTRGIPGTVLKADGAGGFGSYKVASANSDNQTATPTFYVNGSSVIQKGKIPTCQVYVTGTQTIASGSTYKVTTWSTANYDTVAGWDNTNKVIKPQIEGVYYVEALITLAASSSGGFTVTPQLNKNESGVKSFPYLGNYSGSHTNTYRVCAIIYMNGTTDYVDARIYHNMGISATINDGYFSVIYLGNG